LSRVYDVAVVGSGFAGSIFAMIARRLGRSVILLERGRHPRQIAFCVHDFLPFIFLIRRHHIRNFRLPGYSLSPPRN